MRPVGALFGRQSQGAKSLFEIRNIVEGRGKIARAGSCQQACGEQGAPSKLALSTSLKCFRCFSRKSSVGANPSANAGAHGKNPSMHRRRNHTRRSRARGRTDGGGFCREGGYGGS